MSVTAIDIVGVEKRFLCTRTPAGVPLEYGAMLKELVDQSVRHDESRRVPGAAKAIRVLLRVRRRRRDSVHALEGVAGG